MTSTRVIALCTLFCVCLPLQSTGCAQSGDFAGAARLLNESASLLNSEQFEAACSKARAAAKLAPASALVQQRAAEILYRSGASAESVELFDRVIELEPQQAASNWQRGIALCSVGDFERGAKQFKIHHDVNPDDVENSAWYFLCVAKTEGLQAARKTVIPSRGDPRPPMMSILKMFKGEMQPEQVMQLTEDEAEPATTSARFYAALYVGLYYDCLDEPELARKYLKRSLGYGHKGYMVDVARVYLQDRYPAKSQQK